MARPRGENESSTYHEQPEVPPELRRRFELVKAILGQRLSISEAARELDIARNNMQSLVHKVETAIVTALSPRPTGPTAKPSREKELEARVKQLEAQNAKLQHQLTAMDDMLGAAGEIIRSLRGLPPTTSSSRASSRTSRGSGSRKKPTPEDPEPERLPTAALATLARTATTPELARRAARVLGISVVTLRRWLGRLALGRPVVQRRGGRRHAIAPTAEQAVRSHVRALAGLVGAASLAHSVDGVSRRTAARIKQEELTAMERERRAAAARVEITRPGVLRSFDAMHLQTDFVLVASDANVPFRTSTHRVSHYTADSVATALDADFTEHGPPLAVRFDRARCHDAEPVVSVLRAHRVLPLHGPPRHPQYYGQLERQNVEHRGWERVRGLDEPEAMRCALNRLWRRPTLGWRSAEEVWLGRLPVDDDRDQLSDEVEERALRLRTEGVRSDMAMRLAIEQALINRSYLKITPGRPVLRE
jgi:hypothetical protein